MTLNITHTPHSDYSEMPLQDGALSIKELVRFPHASDSNQPFSWQLNITKRESSGEIGKFPGYERHMMQLGGKTITLQHLKHGEFKLSPLMPYSYNGNWETRRNLVGPAEELNLLVRSERLQAKIERVDLRDWKPTFKNLSRYSILWVYQGSIEWVCGDEKRIIKEGETLTVDSAEALNYVLRSKRAVCFIFNIEEKTRS